ncbi:restriction endonuclease [Nocardia asteroides]|uniref:restriction endonuclease n=1 Tax=Nocardia asteroides TaxID=1824 RepID=UPI0034103C15
MAYAVVHTLLPYHDHNYGGLRGVPGLRPRSLSDGTLVLADSLSTAGLILRVPTGFVLRPASSDHGVYDAIWHDHPDSAHPKEDDYLQIWSRPFDAAGARRRDSVLSRALRRPAALQRIGSTHGLAHTWSHWPRDLVISWCCGASESEAKLHLRKSGFTAEVDGIQVDDRESEPWIWWGDTGLDLRRHSTCGFNKDWASSIAAGYKVDEILCRYPRFHHDPPNLRKIDPSDLDVLVQALFTTMGWDSTHPSPAEGDVDFVVTRNPSQRITCAVQVKHATRVLGAETVRSFVDVVARTGFNKGVLVTTGQFTASAHKSAGRHRRIQLIDGAGLVQRLEEHLSIDLTL